MDASLIAKIRDFHKLVNKSFSIVLADDSYRMMSKLPYSLLVFDDTNNIATCFTNSQRSNAKYNDGCVRTTSYDQIMAFESEVGFSDLVTLVTKKVTDGLLTQDDADTFLKALNKTWVNPSAPNSN